MTSALDQIAGQASGFGVTGEMTLEVGLGHLVRMMSKERQRRARLAAELHPVPLVAPALGQQNFTSGSPGSGTISQPEALAPHDGYVWDVRLLTVAGFTAGSVTAYVGDASGSSAQPNIQNQLVTWSAPGTFPWPSGALILQAHDPIKFYCTGIVGNVYIAGRALQFPADLLGEYLL